MGGIMVLQLERWRDGAIVLEVKHWLEMFGAVAGEMMALNFALQDKIDILDWRWNNLWLCFDEIQRKGHWRQPEHCINETRIFHWAGDFKPWTPKAQNRFLHHECHFDVSE